MKQDIESFESWFERNWDDLKGCYEVMEIKKPFRVWCREYYAKFHKVKGYGEQVKMFTSES